MNLFAHIFLGALLSRYLIGPLDILDVVSWGSWLLMIVAATAIDLDHISHLGRAFRTKRFGYISRTRWHEMLGLSIGLLIFLGLSFVTTLSIPLALAFSSHYFADWLTRPTRPFYPWRQEVCHFGAYPQSLRGLTIADAIVTGGMGIWLAMVF